MDRDDFLQAKAFIFRDIHREVQLARVAHASLEALGVNPGGGNFLAALGLLCYTEFGGKLKFARKRQDGRDFASENFNLFFDSLGQSYRDLRKKCNVYDTFRCGLAHEHYVKKSCTIAMLGDELCGITQDRHGRFCFVVESFCRDLERAFCELEQDLCGNARPA